MAAALLVAMALGFVATGCGVMNLQPGRTYHQRCGWKAVDCFTDPKVIALCRAIEANDLAEMERLVQAGADVNARVKGNMTPLLWAFPDNHLTLTAVENGGAGRSKMVALVGVDLP